MAKDDVMMVYATASSRAEAMQIGRVLVEARLAACANVFDGMTAIYHWDGKLQEEDEAVLVLKTTAELLGGLTARLRELHSYDVPCIVSWKIETGDPPYLDWVKGELRKS